MLTRANSPPRMFLAACSVLVFLCAARPAAAETLDLVHESPDIMSINLDLSYSASSKRFSAFGKADQFDRDGSAPPDHAILNANNTTGPFAEFRLDFGVDNVGHVTGGVPGPDLSISGVLDRDNSGTVSGTEAFETLLTGEVIKFGYPQSGGEIFEVTAAVTGGALANEFGTGELGIILNAQNSGFAGLFDVDFANSMSAGNADTFGRTPIPEPSSLAIFGVAAAVGLGLGGRRWMRRRKARPARPADDTTDSPETVRGE